MFNAKEIQEQVVFKAVNDRSDPETAKTSYRAIMVRKKAKITPNG